MTTRFRTGTGLLLGLALVVSASARGADVRDGLKAGTPDIKSMGPLAFGPDGVLFVGDTQGAAVFAIDTQDRGPAASGSLKLEGINQKIAAMLGTDTKQIMINDVAVNPASGKVYLAVSRGTGPDAAPVLMRVDRSGKVEQVSLDNVACAKAALPSPPASGQSRAESITDLAYADGRLIVAGIPMRSSRRAWSSCRCPSPARARARARSRSTTAPTASSRPRPPCGRS